MRAKFIRKNISITRKPFCMAYVSGGNLCNLNLFVIPDKKIIETPFKYE
jgi:hypothetical protein